METAAFLFDQPALRILHANRPATNLVDASVEDLRSMTMADLASDADRRAVRQLLRALLHDGAAEHRLVTRLRGASGTETLVELLVRTFPPRSGRAEPLFVGIVRAVPEEERDEDRRSRSATRMALVEDHARIAHDLNQAVIQPLFAAGLLLQGSLCMVKDPQTAEVVNSVVGQLDEVIAGVRSAVFALEGRPPPVPTGAGEPQPVVGVSRGGLTL